MQYWPDVIKKKKEVFVGNAMDLSKKIDEMFTYHPPGQDQVDSYKSIREQAKILAKVIYDNTPACADQSDAIRKLRECVMVANAAVALRGMV